MKNFLLFVLTLSTLILCISPQPPDFKVSPMIFVKLVGPSDKEPALQIFPLNSDINIKWTSEGIKDDRKLKYKTTILYILKIFCL